MKAHDGTRLVIAEEGDAVYCKFLVGHVDHETAIALYSSHRLFECDGWTGNNYWWTTAKVPESLSLWRERWAADRDPWPALQSALEVAPGARRVDFGAVSRLHPDADLGTLTAVLDDGTPLGADGPPNHIWLLEALTGASDWRVTPIHAARSICAFTLLAEDGAPCGVVTACADGAANDRAIALVSEVAA